MDVYRLLIILNRFLHTAVERSLHGKSGESLNLYLFAAVEL